MSAPWSVRVLSEAQVLSEFPGPTHDQAPHRLCQARRARGTPDARSQRPWPRGSGAGSRSEARHGAACAANAHCRRSGRTRCAAARSLRWIARRRRSSGACAIREGEEELGYRLSHPRKICDCLRQPRRADRAASRLFIARLFARTTAPATAAACRMRARTSKWWRCRWRRPTA